MLLVKQGGADVCVCPVSSGLVATAGKSLTWILVCHLHRPTLRRRHRIRPVSTIGVHTASSRDRLLGTIPVSSRMVVHHRCGSADAVPHVFLLRDKVRGLLLHLFLPHGRFGSGR